MDSVLWTAAGLVVAGLALLASLVAVVRVPWHRLADAERLAGHHRQALPLQVRRELGAAPRGRQRHPDMMPVAIGLEVQAGERTGRDPDDD